MGRARGEGATAFLSPMGLYWVYIKDRQGEVRDMRLYVFLAIILHFLVDFLLLLAVGRLTGCDRIGRSALAAMLGGVYGWVCLLPRFFFMDTLFWHSVCLGLIGMAACGISLRALRQSLLFYLMHMALGGIASGLDGGGFWSVLSAAGLVCVMGFFAFRGRTGKRFVPVKICHQGAQVKLTALEDTGNSLRDPVTGRPVLVVGADVASRLTGLSQAQLQDPVKTMGTLPGLRLVPYKTVGKSSGLLLALKFSDVTIGHWKGNSLVAFAPERLDTEDSYQALTGGAA